MRDLILKSGSGKLQCARMPWENEPGINIPCLPEDPGDVPPEEEPDEIAMPIELIKGNLNDN